MNTVIFINFDNVNLFVIILFVFIDFEFVYYLMYFNNLNEWRIQEKNLNFDTCNTACNSFRDARGVIKTMEVIIFNKFDIIFFVNFYKILY
jgi:hypothetical protein